jgi:hypothetical protein
MLERVFAKGSEFAGQLGQMFLSEDTPGNGSQKQANGVEFDVSGTGGLFLPYRPGAINYVVPQGKDVISSRFTGCYMAKYSYKGETRIAHVATPECNETWAALKASPDVEVQAEFKPTDHVDVGALMSGSGSGSKGEVLGMITATGYCVAVAALRSGHQNTGDTQLTVAALTLVKA